MKLKALEVSQNGIKMYLTNIDAKTLIEKGEVDEWGNKNKAGYQRKISPARAREFSKFIRQNDSISPLSILVNVREKNLSYDNGYLEISDDANFWIVDGQHRVEGLNFAIEKDSKYENFEVPIIITNLEQFNEATNFLIINKTQKGVRSDLAERFLHRYVKKLGSPAVKKLLDEGIMKTIMKGYDWKPKAIDIVDNLNKTNGPWKNKIRSPNDTKGETLVNQKSFTDSLEVLLRDDFFKRLDADTLTKILINYWEAWKEVIPEPFEEPDNYVLLKTTGVFVVNRMLPFISDFATDKNGNRVLQKDKFVEVLDNMSTAKLADYWHKKGGISGIVGAGKMGTSQKTFKTVQEFIEDEIFKNAKNMVGKAII